MVADFLTLVINSILFDSIVDVDMVFGKSRNILHEGKTIEWLALHFFKDFHLIICLDSSHLRLPWLFGRVTTLPRPIPSTWLITDSVTFLFTFSHIGVIRIFGSLKLLTSEKFGPSFSDLFFAPFLGQLLPILLALTLVKLLHLLGCESGWLKVVLTARGSLAGSWLHEPSCWRHSILDWCGRESKVALLHWLWGDWVGDGVVTVELVLLLAEEFVLESCVLRVPLGCSLRCKCGRNDFRRLLIVALRL